MKQHDEASVSLRLPVDHRNIMLSLAIMERLTLSQIHSLCLPDKALATVRRAMKAMQNHAPPLVEKQGRGLVVEVREKEEEEAEGGDALSKTGARPKVVPRRMEDLWYLTNDGLSSIQLDAAFPRKDLPLQYPSRVKRRRNMNVSEHDIQTNDTIIWLIDRVRNLPVGMSAVYLDREHQVPPKVRSPIADALLIFHLGDGTASEPDLIPWTKDYAHQGPRRLAILIETDNATENLEIIAGKARAYRTVFADAQWRAHWHHSFDGCPTPHVIWTAPTERRALRIYEVWRQEIGVNFPWFSWYISTPERMKENQWLGGKRDEPWKIHLLPPKHFPAQRSTRLSELLDYERFAQKAPALPAPPATPPAPPPALPAPAPASPPVVPTPASTTSSAPVVLVPAPGPPAQPAEVIPAPVASKPTPAKPIPLTRTPQLLPLVLRIARAIGKGIWLLIEQLLWPILCWFGRILSALAWTMLKGWQEVTALVFAVALFVWPGWVWMIQPPTIPAASRPAATAVISGSCGQRRVVGSGVRLRAAPGTTSAVLRRLRDGESVQLICRPLEHADGFDWLLVQGNGDAASGWVAAPYLQQP